MIRASNPERWKCIRVRRNSFVQTNLLPCWKAVPPAYGTVATATHAVVVDVLNSVEVSVLQ